VLFSKVIHFKGTDAHSLRLAEDGTDRGAARGSSILTRDVSVFSFHLQNLGKIVWSFFVFSADTAWKLFLNKIATTCLKPFSLVAGIVSYYKEQNNAFYFSQLARDLVWYFQKCSTL
jgi:hypothetical protein